jgi:hypothetical protein
MRHATILFSLLFALGCDAPAAESQGKNYRVKPGESLFAIAERTYGNGLEWPRIWEANPWVDPDRLRAGETIYLPAREKSDAWGDPGNRSAYAPRPADFESPAGEEADNSTRVHMNPGSATPGLGVFRDLANNVSGKTVLGLTLEKAILVLFIVFMLHALVEVVLVWLAANITFVKDVSFKKSMKAIFMTEMLTFTTLVALAVVGILLLYLGTDPGHQASGAQLFPTLEGYLRSPTGLALACFAILGLYIILSLRFLPQVFGVPMSQGITLMTLAILIPHLIGMYLVGQRTGIIQ